MANPAPQPNRRAAQLIALLQGPQGTRHRRLRAAWGGSVRGFISRQFGKKMGLRAALLDGTVSACMH